MANKIFLVFFSLIVVSMSAHEQAPFIFKNISSQDVPQLNTWFSSPHVSQWWPVPEKDEDVIEHFLKRIRSKDTFGYLVMLDGLSLAYIQYYHLDYAHQKTGAWLLSAGLPATTVGIDQFIGDAHFLGKGYGTSFIKEFMRYLRELEPAITTVIVDPDPANHAAIRCYEKVGFKEVGVYTAPWGPALLMRYDMMGGIR